MPLEPAPIRDPISNAQGFLTRPWLLWFRRTQNVINAPGLVLQDTHANRLASYLPGSYAEGSLFDETDRNVLYIVRSGAWVYVGGICSAAQASLPSDLGAADAGFLVNVTDYAHLLRWTGSAWTWAPGDLGSGFIQGFVSDPNPTTGWQVCDGSTVNRLNADGTVTSVTVPNYGTASYLKLGTSASAGPSAASGASGATSGGTPAGTNGANSTSQEVQSGSGVTVAADGHTHTFTGSALSTHTHGAGTLELQRTQLKGYYRR